MSERAWQSTGHVVRVDNFVDRIPEFDRRSGDHLWTVLTMHRVDPQRWGDPTHTPMLDMESLLSVTPIGCYHCESVYTEALAKRRCKGHP